MKKVYSQKASTEVFALAPEQLVIFKSAGYETPTAEEAIADAGAVKLTPPEGKRAYVAFDFKKGEFFVRVKTCTLRGNEYSLPPHSPRNRGGARNRLSIRFRTARVAYMRGGIRQKERRSTLYGEKISRHGYSRKNRGKKAENQETFQRIALGQGSICRRPYRSIRRYLRHAGTPRRRNQRRRIDRGFRTGLAKYEAGVPGPKVVYKGSVYRSTMDGNTWSPEEYPAAWERVE